jgi:hypothetical protein
LEFEFFFITAIYCDLTNKDTIIGFVRWTYKHSIKVGRDAEATKHNISLVVPTAFQFDGFNQELLEKAIKNGKAETPLSLNLVREENK